MYCRCYTFCNSKRCGSMWRCVMFLMLNEDKDSGIRTSQTTNQTKRHKRRHLKQKKKQQPVATTSTCLESCPLLFDCLCASTSHYILIDLACGRMCGFVLSVNACVLGEHPAQCYHYDPTPQTSWQIMPHDRERTRDWPYHATCPFDQL